MKGKIYRFLYLVCNVAKDLQLLNYYCHNPNLGLATKARACKVVGQEGSLGVTSHVLESAKKCEGMNLHTSK
jgi:hypothetical protein